MAGDEKITIRDIARWSGVSIATVSRAVNGSAGVRSEIKARILRSIEDCGWRSNNLKLRLALPEAQRTAVLIAPHGSSAEEHGNIVRLLAEQCRESNFLPLTFVGNSSQALEFCRSSRPFAVVIYYWLGMDDSAVAELIARGVRVVAVSSNGHPGYDCPCFTADRAAEMKAAVRALRQAGHSRIGYFGEFGEYRRYSDRENLSEGHRMRIRGLREEFPEFSPEKDTVGDCYGNLAALGEMLRRKEHSAWICENRSLAKQLHGAACGLGFRIPEDLSVICFGHFNRTPPAWDFPLRFSTVTVDLDRIAARVKTIFGTEAFPSAETMELEPEIEPGASIQPPARR
ncbi:MAG: LacI family DNA-binding transcriptional regulator [Lentisphaeria bacterium]|nr:LacI family DNA-binding transcriptional regulator [Lentisphaeria bacterium]